jgi:cation-transporting ATPase 13A1
MTVLAKVSPGKGQSSLWALVKGSPEAVAKLLAHKPAAYDATYRQMAENGMRVLALAYRPLEGEESDTAAAAAAAGRGVEREGLEQGMVFAGFLAFSCKVRKDTAMVVSELQGGSHRVIMATGDAALTALYVAMKVGITDKEDPSKALLLDPTANVWEQMRHKDADKNNDAPLKKRVSEAHASRSQGGR